MKIEYTEKLTGWRYSAMDQLITILHRLRDIPVKYLADVTFHTAKAAEAIRDGDEGASVARLMCLSEYAKEKKD